MFFILYQATILFGMLVIYILIEMNELDFGKMTPLIVAVGFIFLIHFVFRDIRKTKKYNCSKKIYIFIFYTRSHTLYIYSNKNIF